MFRRHSTLSNSRLTARRIALFLTGIILIAALPGLFTLRSVKADATIITVNDNSDSGTCTTTITLRCAIATANANTITPTTINFNFSGTITVASVLAINNTSQPITIDGSGQTITVDGGHVTQILNISAGTVNLTQLTLINGYASTSNSTNGLGGAVAVIGNTTMIQITGCTFDHNSADVNGGALYVGSSNGAGNDSMVIENSTLFDNSALNGGGVFINFYSHITISNDTFSSNIASTAGGAIFTFYSPVTIGNSTIVDNVAPLNGGGGIYFKWFGSLNLLSNIIARNTGGDVYYQIGGGSTLSVIMSYGHNLIGDGTGSIGLANGANGDQVGTSASPIDPKLANLSLNGGSTQTMALLTGSPALQAGDCTGAAPQFSPPAPAVTIDQRGVARGTPCDIGAYEGSVNPTPTATSTNTASATNTYTLTPTSSNTPTNTASATATATATVTNTSTSTLTPSRTPTNTATATSTPKPAPVDTIGIYRGGTFYLRLHNTTGFADISVAFNPPGSNLPVVGDWTGSGYDTVGVFDRSTANFTLCPGNTTLICSSVATRIIFTFGNPNDTPLAGRWQISATHAGAGVYRPSNGVLYLKNTLSTGFADNAMIIGLPGDSGIAGDWTGKGFDSPGVFRPGNITFYLSNQVTNGPVFADLTAVYGTATDLLIAGDWIAQGHDGIGMFRPTNGNVYLKNAISTGFADNSFFYGTAGDVPIAGHWQANYPPIAPAPVLIAKTTIPQSGGSGIVPGGNHIGG